MCGRYTLRDPKKAAEAFLGKLPRDLPPPRYNIGPGLPVPVIRASPAGGLPEWLNLLWGLIPPWSAHSSTGRVNAMINARAETVAEKPAFRSAFHARRCVVPADGFFEWKKEGNARLPYFFTLDDELPFGLAGIWEPAPQTASPPAGSFCLLTTAANAVMRPVHHRMPVILAPHEVEQWLDPGLRDPERLEKFLAPAPSETMKARPVDPWVNKAGNEGPRCVAPWKGEVQGELF